MTGVLCRMLVCWAFVCLGAVPVVAQELKTFGGDPDLTRLGSEIERLAQGSLGTVGVAVYHLESGRGLTLNGGERFPMASTYKVPMAVELLSQVDEGKRSLEELVTIEESDLIDTHGVISDLLDAPGARLTLENLLGLMLRISDNLATDLIFREAGGADRITARMKAVGAGGIRVDRTTRALIANWLGRDDATVESPIAPAAYNALLAPDHLNRLTAEQMAAFNRKFNADPRDTATPEAMMTLLRLIWQGEILSQSSTAVLIDIMERCQTGQNRLLGMLPPGAKVAHKTGTIGETTNDVGVVYLPGDAGHVVTVVYIKESKLPNNEAMEPVIAQIARAVYDYFVFNRS